MGTCFGLGIGTRLFKALRLELMPVLFAKGVLVDVVMRRFAVPVISLERRDWSNCYRKSGVQYSEYALLAGALLLLLGCR